MNDLVSDFSSTKNTKAAQRTIFHVDVNSAYLSWSALKQLSLSPGSVDLRTVPSAVGGDIKTRHGIITAKSIPAKKYGISTGEPVVKALQKCPHLILVPPDFTTYREYSRRLMEILSEVTPILQQVSIDEAWLDVTDLLPPGDRNAAEALAQHIRQEVSGRLGFTVNVGISSNKLLAKMASDFQKPDRTHTLYPDEISEKMWPLPIESLYGCGHSTARKLRLVGISTIGDAAAADIQMLQSLLGEKAGAYILRSANGISTSPVTPQRDKAKSISNERTLSEDIGSDNFETDGLPVVSSLARKVASRMQKAGVSGQTVTFQVKSTAFQRYSRQTSLEEPTDSADEIEREALYLAKALLTDPDGLFAKGISVRLIGVGVSKLSEKKMQQMNLFDWAAQNLEEEEKEKEREKQQEKQKERHVENQKQKEKEKQQQKLEKQSRLDFMLKKINQRYGEGTLGKGMAGHSSEADKN